MQDSAAECGETAQDVGTCSGGREEPERPDCERIKCVSCISLTRLDYAREELDSSEDCGDGAADPAGIRHNREISIRAPTSAEPSIASGGQS